MTVTALIVAAGKGERLGASAPKQFLPIAGKPVLRWAVEALIGHPAIRAVRVVIGEGQATQAGAALAGLEVGDLINGGAERADSVRAGLAFVNGDDIYVMRADGTERRNLTVFPSSDYAPRWSSDGQLLLFESDREGHWPLIDVA